jgi:4-amino-4-deoxy-L-arabinose transferase-like glycosyltransferase
MDLATFQGQQTLEIRQRITFMVNRYEIWAGGQVIGLAATKGSFPLLLLLLLLAFLWVQDRIDRRDPKLALAPVHADPDLHFTPAIGRVG